MTYLMMTVGNLPAEKSDEKGLREIFNLKSSDFDPNFPPVQMNPQKTEVTVMVTADAAKKMYSKFVDDAAAGIVGPSVQGPFSNPRFEPFR